MPHRIVINALVIMAAFGSVAEAQSTTTPPAHGVVLGAGYERVFISRSPSTPESAWGNGVGFALGYVLDRRWTFLARGSVANLDASNGDFTLSHGDIGARFHLRATRGALLVPFIEGAVTGRTEEFTAITTGGPPPNITRRGAGLTAGGGINWFVTPPLALSASVVWTTGGFSEFKVNGATTGGSTANITTARIHAGVLWATGWP